MKIEVEKEYNVNMQIDQLWNAITDFSMETEFWGNIRDIRILRCEGNVVEREATVGPRPFGSKTKQTITMEPMKTINVKIEGESMNGYRSIELTETGQGKTKAKICWNLDIMEVPAFVEGIATGQLSKATDMAIEKIGLMRAR